MKILLFLLIANLSFGQVVKFRAFESRASMKVNQDWKPIAENNDANVLIVFDFDEQRIEIYAKEPSELDIISSKGPITDSDGDTRIEFTVVDQNNRTCEVWLWKMLDGRVTAALIYEDYMFSYHLKRL